MDKILPQGLTYWIGLEDFADDGTYVWSETHEIASYFNWAEGQPSRADGEDCCWKAVPRLSGEGSPGWHDAGCSETDYHGEIHALCQQWR